MKDWIATFLALALAIGGIYHIWAITSSNEVIAAQTTQIEEVKKERNECVEKAQAVKRLMEIFEKRIQELEMENEDLRNRPAN